MSIAAAILTLEMLAASVASSDREHTLPDIAPPPLGQIEWVAEYMTFNGLPMSLRTFASPLSVDEVLHYYESLGRPRDMKEARRSRRDEWHVLAMKSTRHFVSIQLRQTVRGSEGTIAVSPVPDTARTSHATRFPYPQSVKVVSLQQYRDGDFESEHISMVSFRSVSVEARAYSEMLTRQGWQLVRDEPATATPRAHVIEAQRGAEHVMMTLQPDQTRQATTAIVVVWRKA